MSTRVQIGNLFIPNPAPFDQGASANFVIDGGELRLVGGLGSSLAFRLALSARVFDSADQFDHEIQWVSEIRMVQTAAGLEISFAEEDIGAAIVNPFTVDIPVSGQSVELGTIPASGYLQLGYDLLIEASVAGFAEVVDWRFSDPLSVDGPGPFSDVAFTAALTPVPSPATLPLLASGLSVLWLRRRLT